MDKLGEIRRELGKINIGAFLVPVSNPFFGKTITNHDKRLEWISGFTGSAGLGIITINTAAVFVDGRYSIQARNETISEHFEVLDLEFEIIVEWLSISLRKNTLVGYDDTLHSLQYIRKFSDLLNDVNLVLTPASNPIDQIWSEQPPYPLEQIFDFPINYSGESDSSKRHRIASELHQYNIAYQLLTCPASISWLLNIRSSAKPFSTVPNSFGILHSTGYFQLFVDANNIPESIQVDRINELSILPLKYFQMELANLNGCIQIDPESTSVCIRNWLNQNNVEIIEATDPCKKAMAIKNSVELNGFKQAHKHDGAAFVEILHWLDQQPVYGITELDVVDAIEQFQRYSTKLRDKSFPTIVASGRNGAIIHYQATRESNRPLKPGDMLLIDSGGHYLDGTTDISRTVAIGLPKKQMIQDFTLVLKSLINLSSACWPKELPAIALDAMARTPLWKVGLDYKHGTGHGVGHYLDVHEGWRGISRKSMQPLLEGMVVSIEPGIYKDNEYGIRIENLAIVKKKEWPQDIQTDETFLEFDTLTLAPIDRKLIDVGMLSMHECNWLNSYHASVLAELRNYCRPSIYNWLKAACSPL